MVIPLVCMLSMKDNFILIVNSLNCILASLLRLGPYTFLANRSNNRQMKELIMQYCYIVFQTILLFILSSLQIAFCSVV